VVALHGRAAPKQGDAPADRGMTRARPEPTIPVAMSGGLRVFRFSGKGALSRSRGAVPHGAALCAPATKSLPPPTPHGRGRRTSSPRPFRGWVIRRAKVIFVGSKAG